MPYCTSAIVPRNIYKEKLHKGVRRSSSGHKKHKNIDNNDKTSPTVNEDEIRTEPKYPHIIANRMEFQIEDNSRKFSENAIDASGFEAESLTEEHSKELEKEISEATFKEDIEKEFNNNNKNDGNITANEINSVSEVKETTVVTTENGNSIEQDIYAKFYVNDRKGDVLRSILSGLRKLEWIRYDVLFTSALHIVHRQIICQTGTGLPGHDILEHAKDIFYATLQHT